MSEDQDWRLKAELDAEDRRSTLDHLLGRVRGPNVAASERYQLTVVTNEHLMSMLEARELTLRLLPADQARIDEYLSQHGFRLIQLRPALDGTVVTMDEIVERLRPLVLPMIGGDEIEHRYGVAKRSARSVRELGADIDDGGEGSSLVSRRNAAERVDIALVAAIHRHYLELAGERRVEVVDVDGHADDVFLNDVLLLDEMRRARMKIGGVLDEQVAFAALRAVELDDDGPIDFARLTELPRHAQARLEQPLALAHAIGFPIEDRLVAEIRGRHRLMLFERQVRHERPVRHQDNFAPG